MNVGVLRFDVPVTGVYDLYARYACQCGPGETELLNRDRSAAATLDGELTFTLFAGANTGGFDDEDQSTHLEKEGIKLVQGKHTLRLKTGKGRSTPHIGWIEFRKSD